MLNDIQKLEDICKKEKSKLQIKFVSDKNCVKNENRNDIKMKSEIVMTNCLMQK